MFSFEGDVSNFYGRGIARNIEVCRVSQVERGVSRLTNWALNHPDGSSHSFEGGDH